VRKLVVAATFLGLVACGYSSKRLTHVEGVRTIAVAQFDNATYRRDLEFRLTQAVAQEVRARTSFRIASPESADAVLTGTIRSAETTLLIEERDTDEPIEQRFRWVVDARLVDRRTGNVIREWRAVDRAEWTEGRFGETLDAYATDVLARLLAEQVVQGLERPVGSADTVPPTPIPPRKHR
jgi:Lipopolysaccharide-assembly